MWMFALPLSIDGRNGIDLVVGSKGPGASIGWLQSPARPRRLTVTEAQSGRSVVAIETTRFRYPRRWS